MKRNVMLTLVMILLINLFSCLVFAQEEGNLEDNQVVEEVADVSSVQDQEIEDAPEVGGLELLARKIMGSGFVDTFISGGFAMWPILLLVLWGLAVIIWKLVSISYAKINIHNLLDKVIPLVDDGKYNEASEICRNTRGPVAVIMHQGLLKAEKGIYAVEKEIENAAALEMAYLDKGFVALGTVISLAPMFGFFGTLIGMILAFEAIAKAGEVDPTIVADGIKVALITSAAGLAVAIPMQFFNNIFQTMVDGLIIDMQIGTEKMVETLVEREQGE